MEALFSYVFFVSLGLIIVSVIFGVVDIGTDVNVDVPDGDLSHGGSAVSPINFQTVIGFWIGFGGTGYLATKLGSPGLLASILVAIVGGVVVGWLVLTFMRFLVRGERPLKPTSHIGTVGHLTAAIREGSVGEMVYDNHGTRGVLSVRSDDGHPIAKGKEVVVLRYEKGVGYVQPWDEFLASKEREQN